jgi:hypothetical protein
MVSWVGATRKRIIPIVLKPEQGATVMAIAVHIAAIGLAAEPWELKRFSCRIFSLPVAAPNQAVSI